MTNKGKKKFEKKVRTPEFNIEETVEVQPMVIDPEVFETKLFVEEPEEVIENEFTEEVEDEFPPAEGVEPPVEEPVLEGLKYAEDFKPEDYPDAITLESHTEPCVCEEPCVEPCVCEEPCTEDCICNSEDIKETLEMYHNVDAEAEITKLFAASQEKPVEAPKKRRNMTPREFLVYQHTGVLPKFE